MNVRSNAQFHPSLSVNVTALRIRPADHTGLGPHHEIHTRFSKPGAPSDRVTRPACPRRRRAGSRARLPGSRGPEPSSSPDGDVVVADYRTAQTTTASLDSLVAESEAARRRAEFAICLRRARRRRRRFDGASAPLRRSTSGARSDRDVARLSENSERLYESDNGV